MRQLPSSRKHALLLVPETHHAVSEERSSADVNLEPSAGLPEHIVLALPTSTCFFVSREFSHWKHPPEHDVAAYDLEKFLPLDAEQLACTTLRSPQGWFCVATDARRWTTVIENVEQKGIWIAAISPLVLLGLGKILRDKSRRGDLIIFWQNGQTIDVLQIQSQQIRAWYWITANQPAVQSLINSFGDELRMAKCLGISLAPAIEEQLCATEQFESASFLELSQQEAAAEEATAIADGVTSPIIDLRQGPLAASDPLRPIRPQLKQVLYLTALLMLVLSGSLFWRAGLYRSAAAQKQLQQEDLFRELFPEQRLPVGVVARVESEYRRLAGEKGVGMSSLPQLGSVVPMLHTWLSAMPEEPRYRWETLQFAPEELVLGLGTAKSFNDANLVLQSLRTAGIDAPPLSATKSNTGVSIRLENVKRLAAVSNDATHPPSQSGPPAEQP